MKYWRGYLTAAVLAAITWALIEMGKKFTTLVDLVYPYVTRTIQNLLTPWTGTVDFCVWQVALVVFGVILLATIVLMILLRWNFFQWLGWVLTAAACLFFLHTGIYGLNYHAGPLADDVRLDTTVASGTAGELADATTYYRDMANELAMKVSRDADGNVRFPSFEELAEQAGDGFKTLTYDHSFSVFAGVTDPVKKLGWADMYTSMGITGVTMPLTGEAAVNPQTPAVALPFVMCHEMAHRMCIAVERDANFAAFLTCRVNSSIEFQYSAYFMAYRYCYSALSSLNTPEAATAAARIATGVNEYLGQDLNAYARFFADNADEDAGKLADSANDAYIKISGDESGTNSYGEVSQLLTAWHIQEIVLPAQREENESTFDPYDETQVDLSGIVGAMGG